MTPSDHIRTRRIAFASLVIAAAALVFIANGLLSRVGTLEALLPLAAAALGLGALWLAFSRLNRHFRVLDAAIAHPAPDHPRGGEGRWPVIATALDQPVMVVGESGRVVDANPAALRLLGEGAAPGRPVGDVLDRAALIRAVERARGSGGSVTTALPTAAGGELTVRVADQGLGAGAVLVFPVPSAPAAEAEGSVPVLPPFPVRDMLDESLATAPLVALRVVTAPGGERVLAMGTVRLSGARLFRTLSLDVLVNPGVALAGTVAGIAPEMVAGERPFPLAWPVIHDSLHHAVVAGYGVEEALGALAGELAHAGLPPLEPLARIDLGHLAAALGRDAAPPDGHLAQPVGEAASHLLQEAIKNGAATVGDAVRLAEAVPGGTAP